MPIFCAVVGNTEVVRSFRDALNSASEDLIDPTEDDSGTLTRNVWWPTTDNPLANILFIYDVNELYEPHVVLVLLPLDSDSLGSTTGSPEEQVKSKITWVNFILLQMHWSGEIVVVANFFGTDRFDWVDICVAFGLHAKKLFMRSDYSQESLKEFITAIVEAKKKTPQGWQQICSAEPNPLTFDVTPFPCAGAIDIVYMSSSSARSMLQFWAQDPRKLLEQLAIREWFAAGNWPAIKEFVHSNAAENVEIDFAGSSLKKVPHQLEGISCATLNLEDNHINEIPEWVLHVKAQVDISKNFLISLPKWLQRRPSQTIRHFLLFGEIPAEPAPTTNRIVLVGGPCCIRVGLLKCLMGNKQKTPVKPLKTTSPVIQVHKPFKLGNVAATWTAWDLGGETDAWHPFYQCFFLSNSIFILLFAASAVSFGSGDTHYLALPKLNFWLTQICSCHSHKSYRRWFQSDPKTKVILVASYNDPTLTEASFLEGLFSAVTNRWATKINFGETYFAVNPAVGEGFIFDKSSPKGRFHADIISRISISLDSWSNIPICVPRSWVLLREHIGIVNRKTLKWSQLVRLACDCGVGRVTGKRNLFEQQRELNLCFEWLSDIGSIFHFKHSIFPASEKRNQGTWNNLEELVVLQPSWFNDILTSIAQTFSRSVATTLPSSSFETIRPNTVGLAPEAFSVLLKLGMMMNIDSEPRMSFFVLPHTTPNHFTTLRNIRTENSKVLVSGCIVQFGFLPEETFTRVMSSLCNIPGVHMKYFWRDGIVVSKRSNDQTQTSYMLVNRVLGEIKFKGCPKCGNPIAKERNSSNIHMACQNSAGGCGYEFCWLCREPWSRHGKATGGNHCCHRYSASDVRKEDMEQFPAVEVIMKTASQVEKPISWKNNLMNTAVNLLYSAQSTLQTPEERLLFLCPECLAQYLSSVSVSEESRTIRPITEKLSYFSSKQIVDAVSRKSIFLECSRKHIVSPAKVASNLFSLGFSDVIRTDEGNTSNTITIGPTDLGDGKAGTVQVIPMVDPNCPTGSPELLIAEVNKLSPAKDHPCVATFFGVALRGTALMGLREYLPPLNITPHGSPCQVLSLSDLLKALHQHGNEALDQVLPQNLREKIMKNIAQGLNHLHRHIPPIVHGDVHIRNVLLISLDPAGPGPWAKISHKILTAASATAELAPSGIILSPEAILGNTPPGTHTDAWNFGLLVHSVVAPLSLVHLKSTSPPHITSKKTVPARNRYHSRTKANHTTSTAAMSDTARRTPPQSTAFNSPGDSGPEGTEGHRRVDVFQVGYALASGAFIVDTDYYWATMPRWVAPTIGFCLDPSPLTRISMGALENMWGFFGTC
ncbi:hypothetical protein Pelo_16756 [Pelomyxa schiedti]|nr:hypothetical protein Pelo_16756 [Pelomyxa schiedti]